MSRMWYDDGIEVRMMSITREVNTISLSRPANLVDAKLLCITEIGMNGFLFGYSQVSETVTLKHTFSYTITHKT